ncbi:carboxymuconolactone decarboxylase family protein [Nocardia otitidiscaviarum]|uniref:carboxymuconolactone decarboxylase family protein n=1 Tax=Nocardia otitidiscaviarum TaxID=1823 RepID=UPI0004A702A7|nr:carboxymuconolactone decarboxylase family protein [Nocardia otitidiscaviarum]MBF6133118.1 carboxymuconolactone decarboxylase family protein [Nocardia otitidiscaviarum]MBF6486514.1 carboxymuconolactone decarboxylase family protein [Nocardia otitidiscaviarum]
MSRLPLIQPESATGKAADLLAGVQQALGVTPNMTKAMVNSPAVLEAYLGFSGALGGGVLAAPTRERIALLVAEENGCDYCLSAHSYIGANIAKLTAEEIEANRHGRSSDAKAEAVLTFAAAVVRSRGGVEEADVKAARAAGLTDGEIVETIANVALNVFTNYLNKAVETDIDWPVVRHHEH